MLAMLCNLHSVSCSVVVTAVRRRDKSLKPQSQSFSRSASIQSNDLLHDEADISAIESKPARWSGTRDRRGMHAQRAPAISSHRTTRTVSSKSQPVTASRSVPALPISRRYSFQPGRPARHAPAPGPKLSRERREVVSVLAARAVEPDNHSPSELRSRAAIGAWTTSRLNGIKRSSCCTRPPMIVG